MKYFAIAKSKLSKTCNDVCRFSCTAVLKKVLNLYWLNVHDLEPAATVSHTV